MLDIDPGTVAKTTEVKFWQKIPTRATIDFGVG
jgi:hypothetical protein